MSRAAQILGSTVCLAAAWLSVPERLSATDLHLNLIVHRERARGLTVGEVRAIYLKQKLFWDDGQPIVPIHLEAGSRVREIFSLRIFGQDSRHQAAFWNQRYFEAGEFPPATLASEDAVVRFVSGNANAVGYVTATPLEPQVSIALVLREPDTTATRPSTTAPKSER